MKNARYKVPHYVIHTSMKTSYLGTKFRLAEGKRAALSTHTSLDANQLFCVNPCSCRVGVSSDL